MTGRVGWKFFLQEFFDRRPAWRLKDKSLIFIEEQIFGEKTLIINGEL